MFELREHGWMWKVTPSGKRFQVSEFRHQSIYLFGSLTFFQISKRTNQIHIIPSRSACVTLSFKTNAVTESELLPDSSTFLLASLRSLIEMPKKKKKSIQQIFEEKDPWLQRVSPHFWHQTCTVTDTSPAICRFLVIAYSVFFIFFFNASRISCMNWQLQNQEAQLVLNRC